MVFKGFRRIWKALEGLEIYSKVLKGIESCMKEYLFMQVMKVLEKKWRSQGIICFIYLDDIRLFGALKKLVHKHLLILIQDILEAASKSTPKSVCWKLPRS